MAPGFRRGGDLCGHRAAGADGHAQDDEIGAAHRFGRAIGVTSSASPSARHALHAPRGESSAATIVAREAPAPRSARERRADQPDADEGQPFEERLGQRVPIRQPRVASAQEIAQSADDEAIGFLRADRQAQGIRQAVGADARAGSTRAPTGTRRRPRASGPACRGNG